MGFRTWIYKNIGIRLKKFDNHKKEEDGLCTENKSIQEQMGVIKIYDNTEDDLVKKIHEFLDLPEIEKEIIGRKSIDAYERFYTPRIFAQNYLSLIEKIIKDYEEKDLP